MKVQESPTVNEIEIVNIGGIFLLCSEGGDCGKGTLNV